MTDRQRIREVFESLVDLPPEARREQLAALEPELRDAVEAMLARHDALDDFLDVPEPADATATDLPFDRIGDVRVVAEIGSGGMGAVYRGVDEASGENVAVKVLFFGMAGSETTRRRFETEGEIMSRLQHPSIVRVRGTGQDRGSPYLVMDLVEGSSLAIENDPARRTGLGPDPADPRAVAGFLAQVADALAHAHGQNVLHRDVKPSNILIDREGRPRLTDFGLARDLEVDGPTRSGDVSGTFAYMSPEQIRGDRHAIDEGTDVFALGIVLYEILAGRRPFSGGSAVDLALDMERADPPDVRKLSDRVPRDLGTICMKAIETDRRDRYATMREMADDLRAVADGRPIGARPPTVGRRVQRTLVRRRRPFAVAAAILVVGILGLGAGQWWPDPTGTPVDLISDPPGADVWVRPWDLDRKDFGPAEALGPAGRRVHVEPGLARFVFLNDRGELAELSRTVPPREQLEDGFVIEATLVDSVTALAGMHRIPGGEFSMMAVRVGRMDDRIDRWRGPAFAIDEREVTIGEFAAFVEATGRDRSVYRLLSLPDSLHDRPMADVTFAEARAYAEWQGKRLPTHLEFLRMAGGDAVRDEGWRPSTTPLGLERTHVVGRSLDDEIADAIGKYEHFARVVPPAGTHPQDRSDYGPVDVIGSVAEFVDQPWISYGRQDSLGTVSWDKRGAAGASWAVEPRSAMWSLLGPSEIHAESYVYQGFRCARSLEPLATFERLGSQVVETP